MLTEPEYRRKDNAQRAAARRRKSPEAKRARRRRREEAWAARDPEGFKLHKKIKRSRNKARRRGAVGFHTPRDVAALLKVQRGRCAYFRTCGSRLGENFHVDHVLPICLGGTNDRGNLQLTCAACNISKGGKHPVEFAQGLGLLI